MTTTEPAAPHPILDTMQRAGVLLHSLLHPARLDELAFLNGLHAKALACRGNVAAILELARELGDSAPHPQQGRTRELWQILATLGCADLSVGRIVEPHLDAIAILQQAGQEDLHRSGSTWGVYAAQGPGAPLTGTTEGGQWLLTGDKPWCSLAGELSHALITAQTPAGVQLFAVNLRHAGITASPRPWQALGLATVPSSGLSLTQVPAVAVGEPNWYLERPGFAWGGVGVAAVWHGAATAIARRLHQHSVSRTPDQLALWHLGVTDQALWSAVTAFQVAAELADAGHARTGTDDAAGTQDSMGHSHGVLQDDGTAAIMASRLRATVAGAAEAVLTRAAHGMGPEPLAFEGEHAQRVADLELYLRQDHAERSLARHGAGLLASSRIGALAVAPW